MAILKDGIFGGISGRVGNTVYYMRNGKQMSRMLGRIKKPPTIPQLANRQGMKVAIDFLRPLSLFIRTGFELEAAKRKIYPQNAAVGYNKSNALKGEYPDIGIDFAKVLMSKGDLQGLFHPSASLMGSAQDGYAVRFNWDLDPEEQEWPRCNDEVLLLAYFPSVSVPAQEDDAGFIREAKAYIKLDGARRKDRQDELRLPDHPERGAMELYIAAVSQDRKKIANSQYLGQILLP